MRKSSVAQRSTSRSRLQNLNPVFHKRDKSEDDAAISRALLKQARTSGNLNLSGRALATVPDKVFELNESDKDVEVTLEELVAKEEDAWWNQIPLANLDLSSNTLIELSPKIKNLNSLTTLTLHNNSLSSIPKEIGTLEKLKHVNLSRNKLHELPLEFFTLPDLRYLNLSYNNFMELATGVSDLYMLEIMDVSHNNLTSLPDGIGFLVRLTQLLLSHNHIKELPADLVNMRSLQKLDLVQNDLIALPEDMGSLRRLQCLYLQHNDIVTVPAFEGCEDLQEIYLANNYISTLPSSFCSELPHLKILDLRDNKISKIPDEVELLKSLKRLDLTNNSIKNLPCSLSSLAHLVSLQVDGNPIKSIRRDVLQCGTTRILKTLRDRALSESSSNSSLLNNMASEGSELGENSNYPDKYQLRKTHCLAVTCKNLSEVPDKIFELAYAENVNIVDFSRNRLTSLPNGLQNMRHCATELIFANNLIRSIPRFIAQFTRLFVVDLTSNILSELPTEFGLLSTLRELNISNNRFTTLPKCVYELRSLEVLRAHDNLITKIDASPSGLGALTRLATLNLRNNSIEHIPPVLGNLEHITFLDIMGNPFREPRHQLLEKGTDAVMTHLRARIPA